MAILQTTVKVQPTFPRCPFCIDFLHNNPVSTQFKQTHWSPVLSSRSWSHSLLSKLTNHIPSHLLLSNQANPIHSTRILVRRDTFKLFGCDHCHINFFPTAHFFLNPDSPSDEFDFTHLIMHAYIYTIVKFCTFKSTIGSFLYLYLQ